MIDISYTKKGIIDMLRRDKNVKAAPNRFQDSKEVESLDVCICFDERVFDSVLEGIYINILRSRSSTSSL